MALSLIHNRRGGVFFRKTKKLDRALEAAKAKIELLVTEHIQTLARKRIQGITVDLYGVVDASRWMKECQHFVDKVVRPRLTDDEASAVAAAGLSQIATELIEKPAQVECERIEQSSKYDDAISPLDYERYCSARLASAGWGCSLTKGSGDQGVDIIAKKDGRILVVQCKKYSGTVGNGAVQEVISAKKFFHADYAAVVTNATYTKSAIELASVASVLLLSHTDLDQIDRRLTPLR